MSIVECLECHKTFYTKLNNLTRGYGKYCSRDCANRGQRTGKMVPCFICKTSTYKSPKDQRRSSSGAFFCSKSCQTIWRNSKLYTGGNHINWRGGRSSYRQRLLRSDLPKVCSKCSTNDNRVLAVHHKDQNRLNNDFSNLIWLCHNCHYLVHHFADESKGFVVPVA